MVAILVRVRSSSTTVSLRPRCMMNSKSSLKSVKKCLATLFGGVVDDMELRASTSDSESERSIDEFEMTAEEFQSKGGEIHVDVTNFTTGVFACCAKLEGTVKTLQRNLQEQNLSHEERITKLDKQVEELQQRVTSLEVESDEFGKIVLRSVVEDVHSKLQTALGDKPDTMSWEDYLLKMLHSHRAWFDSHKLGLSELALLQKSFDTPFQAGSVAAHRPKRHLVERVVLRSNYASWKTLWNFLNA